MSASRIGNMEKGNEKVKKQGRKNTAVLELKAALINPRNGNHLEWTKSQISGEMAFDLPMLRLQVY